MVRLLARGLSEAAVETHVATTDDGTLRHLAMPYAEPVVDEGVTYWYFRRQSNFYKVSWPLTTWLSDHVADYQLVHIHALFSYAASAAAYWALRRRVPYIVRPLGTLNRWGRENRRPWLKNASIHFIERRILQNAAAVHFTSEQEDQEARELGIRYHSEIIPNPASCPPTSDHAGQFRAQYPELQGRDIILFLSRFDRKKGLDLLLPAFARVRQQCPSAALVLAGAGDPALVAEIRAQAHDLGIESDIVWTGFLEGDAKWAAFADASVFVLPSYSENFGIAAVEALAAGCPVIVSDQVAIQGEIAASGAGLVAPCDVGELAKALGAMLSDRKARELMADRARILVRERYSLEAVTKRVIAVYDASLKMSRRP